MDTLLYKLKSKFKRSQSLNRSEEGEISLEMFVRLGRKAKSFRKQFVGNFLQGGQYILGDNIVVGREEHVVEVLLY